MTCDEAADRFRADWRGYGRINSKHTDNSYGLALTALSEETGNRDPRTHSRSDVKRTLMRWAHPNTQAARRAAMNSFYKWCMQEGIRKDNPVDQVPPPKKREAQVYRMNLAEVRQLAEACNTARERRAIYLGLFAGLRNEEMCILTGADFDRVGAIRVFGKGKKERFLPVIADLQPVVDEIRANVSPSGLVFPGRHRVRTPITTHGMLDIVSRVRDRAGMNNRITVHTLRHAFGDHIGRHAGARNAQFLLGHKDIGTTQIYMGKPTLDELTEAVSGTPLRLPPAVTPFPALRPLECLLISGIEATRRSKAFGEVLVRLRAGLAPVAEGLS